MERLVIISHDSHTLFIEDVDENLLREKYNGEEEAYIKDNYCISDNYSWDYITGTRYIPNKEETEVYDIEFSDWI